jgi:SSS family solute:Na+ symporter
MSSLSIWALAIIIGVGALFALIAIYGQRLVKAKNLLSYYLADRTVGPIIAALTMAATLMSAFILVGATGFFYTHGIGSWAYIAIGDTLLVLMVPIFGYKLWKLSKKFGYVSPLEFLRDRYENRAVAFIAALITIIFLMPYMSLQLAGIGKLLNSVTGGELNYLVGVFLAAFMVVLITQLGGMRSVAWTDAIQGFYMFIIALILAIGFLVMEFGGSLSNLFSRVAAVEPALLSAPGPTGLFSIGMIISFYIMVIFMPVTQMQLTQRYMIIRDKAAFRGLMIGTAIVPAIALFPAMIFGFGGKVLWSDLASGDMSFGRILASYFPIPLIALGLVAVFAACLSTVDSQILVIGSIVGKDVYENIGQQRKQEKSTILFSRILMLVVTAIVVLISLNPPRLIVTLAILSYSYTLQLAPTLMGAIYWKKGTAAGAISSMASGVGLMLLDQINVVPLPPVLHPSTWALILSSVVYIVVSLATSAPKAQANKIVEYLQSGGTT